MVLSVLLERMTNFIIHVRSYIMYFYLGGIIN